MGDLMRSNDMPRTPTDGIDALLMRVEAIKRELKDATNGLLKAAGISVTPTGMSINSSLDVTGDLSATGNTTIGGNAKITGTLDLPAGIIGNDALASPVTADVGSASTPGAVILSTAPTLYASITLNVPAGFTRAVVTASSVISFGGTVAVEMATRIGGVEGTVMYAYGDSSSSVGNGSTNFSRNFAVVSGGSFVVETRCTSGEAGANGIVSTAATVTYFRS